MYEEIMFVRNSHFQRIYKYKLLKWKQRMKTVNKKLHFIAKLVF